MAEKIPKNEVRPISGRFLIKLHSYISISSVLKYHESNS